jgi:threonine aldolase
MIDLFSDTMTRPSAAMRQAMLNVEVGDEQRREDPTTNRLQEMVAALLGKEAAVFLPSGTMCNEIAIKTHTQPGDAIICDLLAHVYRSEFGGPALLSGVTAEPISGRQGIFTADQLKETLSRFGGYGPPPRLLCVEQTHNFGCGAVWPLEQLKEVSELAKERGMTTHMDGARLMNAQVQSGIPAAELAAGFDSAWVDLSKGLGCGVGAVLAGSREFIERAWRYKHLFGGALRQSGMLAAAGIYALENNVQRLSQDHDNARLLAAGLSRLAAVKLDVPEPQTNIVFFQIVHDRITLTDFLKQMLSRGVRFSNINGRVRAVTHLDVSKADIEQTIAHARAVLAA